MAQNNDGGKWLVWKDRLAIMAVIVILLVFLLMMFLDSIMNIQCTAWEFFTFQCNRFDAHY